MDGSAGADWTAISLELSWGRVAQEGLLKAGGGSHAQERSPGGGVAADSGNVEMAPCAQGRLFEERRWTRDQADPRRTHCAD